MFLWTKMPSSGFGLAVLIETGALVLVETQLLTRDCTPNCENSYPVGKRFLIDSGVVTPILRATLRAHKSNTDSEQKSEPLMPSPLGAIRVILLLCLLGVAGSLEPSFPELEGAKATLGPFGGTLTSGDGRLRLDLPLGALDADVEIEIVPTQSAAGAVVAYQVTPAGALLWEPARVTFRFDTVGLGTAVIADLRVARQLDGVWEPLSDQFLDLSSRVTGDTKVLGMFGLVAAGCRSDADCVEPQRCSTYTCRSLPCLTSDECGLGEVCELGLCKALEVCSSEQDCFPTHRCELGACISRGACSTPGDCSDAERCEAGSCVAAASCNSDSQCAEGESCAGEQCVVAVQCGLDTECSGGLCVDGECTSSDCVTNVDCLPGTLCVDGVCAPNTSCQSDADCSSGRLCVNGVCTAT